MAKKARFVAWDPKVEMPAPRDLPVGAVYVNDCGEEIEVAGVDHPFTPYGSGGKAYILRKLSREATNRTAYCPMVLGIVASNPVESIVHWPDNAGPRPDTERKPTWNEVIARAPSKDALAVFSYRGNGKPFSCPVSEYTRSDLSPTDDFHGWLTID